MWPDKSSCLICSLKKRKETEGEMKKLIIVRHGHYGHDFCLSHFGKRQIEALAKELHVHIGDKKRALILSSTAPRAHGSTEVLSEKLKINHELHDVLWSEAGRQEDLPKTLELVRKQKGRVDFLILVTHLEYLEYFPDYFGKHELGLKTRIMHGHLPKVGQALIIDCHGKKVSLVSPY